MIFDPEMYMLKIRKETIDNECYYVGRVEEFPDICVYEDSHDEAYKGLIAVMQLLPNLIERNGLAIPEPVDMMDEYSGRLTLRLSKSNHKSVAQIAKNEGVSINQLVAQYVNVGVTGAQINEQISSTLEPVVIQMRRSLHKAEIDRAYRTSKTLDALPVDKPSTLYVINGGLNE